VGKGYDAIVKLLLETDNINVNWKGKTGWTPLSYAIEGGYKNIVELLLEAGAKVDYEYTINVSEHTLSLVYISIESIANPSISGCYSM
jgi:ankyrin repeat protein